MKPDNLEERYDCFYFLFLIWEYYPGQSCNLLAHVQDYDIEVKSSGANTLVSD